MIDRLRDGKFPIGSCTMSDGAEFDDHDLDHRWLSTASRAAWECPEGKQLHHSVSYDDGNRREAMAFCYEARITRRFGDGYRTSYSGISRPDRTDFEARLQISPGTAAAWDPGLLRFYTGRDRDWRTIISYHP